jgi:hypothetical protein
MAYLNIFCLLDFSTDKNHGEKYEDLQARVWLMTVSSNTLFQTLTEQLAVNAVAPASIQQQYVFSLPVML